ncbi:MAG: TIGR03088 family PEP-CTERM/XrtA system glycosyltransferase [Woeseia sp.]
MNAKTTAESRAAAPPLIAHIVFRFDYGGLENGLVNLINRMPEDAFRHCIIALTEVTGFRHRVQKPSVAIHALGKKPGKDFGAYFRLWRLLRRLKPDVVHTRNIGTLDCVPVARLAGVPVCIHGEHGWDVHDPDGTKRKYRRLRKMMFPLVRRVIAVSSDLKRWLVQTVGVARSKVTRICNGVDTECFHPRRDDERHPALADRFSVDTVLAGSVLRFMDIKDPMNLVEAFISARPRAEAAGVNVGLVMIGDGPLRQTALDALEAAGLADAAWLPGSRDDVPALMRSLDIFVLGSRREGISNTLLEAMASGLPLVATDTGGNRELVQPGLTGALVQPENREAMAGEILRYALDKTSRETQGWAARGRALREYSLDSMVSRYRSVYQDALARMSG